MWNLKDLISHCGENNAEIDGEWVPARPINWTCRSLFEKAREAWMVFTGKAEAFVWPKGQ